MFLRELLTARCPTSPVVRQLHWGQGSNRLGSFLLWSLLENCKEEVCLSELLTATPTSHLLLSITLLSRSSVLSIRTIAIHAKLYPLGSRRFLTKCLLEGHLSCFCDVNDGIGAKEVGGSLQLLESTVVSELAAGKENLPGGAGESLRSVLEAHDLVSVSSWWGGRPTFFGTGSHCSLLDHLFLPSALLQAVRTAGP